MAAQNLRELVEARLDALNDQELRAVLHYIEAMQRTSLPEITTKPMTPRLDFLPPNRTLPVVLKKFCKRGLDGQNHSLRKHLDG